MENKIENEIMIAPGYNTQVWNQMKDMAQVFYTSKAIPSNITNAPQLMVVMQAGFEMGMKPFESIKSLTLINGQWSIWGQAITRRLREHGWRISYVMKTDNNGTCIATVKKGDEEYTESYSYDSADKSGYTKDSKGNLKVGWKTGINRTLKLRYGALSVIIKTYIAEVMGVAMEIAEVAQDYEIPEEGIIEETQSDGKNIIIKGADKTAIGDFIEKAKAKKEAEKNPQDHGKDINVPTKPEKEGLDNAQKDDSVEVVSNENTEQK